MLFSSRIAEKVKKLGLVDGPRHLKNKKLKRSLDEMTHVQDERKKPKKGKKRKANDEVCDVWQTYIYYNNTCIMFSITCNF